MEYICLWILTNRDGKGIYKTAFRNRNDAIAHLKLFPNKFIAHRTRPIFTYADQKAYYATHSYSKELDGNKELFGVTLSRYVSPTKSRLYATDPCIKDITSDNIIDQSNDWNKITIRDTDGYYHFRIRSIDIV